MLVSCASPFSVGSFVWQPRPGAFALTVVCKARYALEQGVSPIIAAPGEPSFSDVHWQDNPAASVQTPSDRVPFKRRVDVLVGGHVHAPGGQRVRSLVARLAVGTIHKPVAVFGTRYWAPDGSMSGPGPFTKMPLLWELAEGGPGTWNPVGIPAVAPAGIRRPLPLPAFEPVGLVRQGPGHGSMPVGLGPLSPTWPTRTMYLRHHRATWSHETWHEAPLPGDLDAAYFNSAPPDQQLERLLDRTPLYLGHLHAEIPSLTTVIEAIRPRALVTRSAVAPEEVDLQCDTLFIDADQGTCTLTWRATVPLSHPGEKGIVYVRPARGGLAEVATGPGSPAGAPAEEPPEEAPPETIQLFEIEDEETTSTGATAGLVLSHGPLRLGYSPPDAAGVSRGGLFPIRLAAMPPAPAEVDIEDEETRTSLPEEPAPPPPVRQARLRPPTLPLPRTSAPPEPALPFLSAPPTSPFPPSPPSAQPVTLPLPLPSTRSRPRPATLPLPTTSSSAPPPALPFSPAPAPPATSPGAFRSSPRPFSSVPALAPAVPAPVRSSEGGTVVDEDDTVAPELYTYSVLPFPPAAPGAAARMPFGPAAPRAASLGSSMVLGRAPLGIVAPPRSSGASFDDDVTYTEPPAVVAAPLPFQPAGLLPSSPVAPLVTPASPLLSSPVAPLVTPASPLLSSPVAVSLGEHREAPAGDASARPAAPAISLEQYARVKSELWGADASLNEALERHGIDEIAWRVHERRQAEALAAEAREGRCDLALALIEAFESAKKGKAEAPFAVVPAGGAP